LFLSAVSLQIGITMEDLKALAIPWKAELLYRLKSDEKVMELACSDNAAFEGFEK